MNPNVNPVPKPADDAASQGYVTAFHFPQDFSNEHFLDPDAPDVIYSPRVPRAGPGSCEACRTHNQSVLLFQNSANQSQDGLETEDNKDQGLEMRSYHVDCCGQW